jgi:DNA-binding response OmpR family regulator
VNSMYRDSYSHRLKRWLDAVGLVEDPFALYEAEREGTRLSSFFVDRPYLYEVLGDPAAPQAAFLMAGRGCGKTATRAMVAYECQHGKFKGRVLVVHYTDFAPLLMQVSHDLACPSSHHHVRAVMRFALQAVAEHLAPDNLEALSEVSRKLLMGFAQEFADSVSRFQIAAVIGNTGANLDWKSLSPREILQIFARLVADMGREAIYVLVDRVDETPETATHPEKSVALLKPLVEDQPLLEMPHVAFKFFLPTTVGTTLHQRVPIRRDRVMVREVNWDRSTLKELIQLRLRYFSQDRVPRLEDLCAPEARYAVMDRLVNACESSPRTLLRLCRALIQHHVKDTNTSLLISRSDVTNTLYEFLHQLEQEQDQRVRSTDAGTPVSTTRAPPEKGLYLDDHGHVWVDSVKMARAPSPSEIRLLEALYNRAPDIVGNEELIRAVWSTGTTPWEAEAQPLRAEDETNLRKLVARLRRRLESQFPGASSRFIQNVRGRGYWLKVE